MIVPSIDLEAGHAVQLIGGADKALDAGDPRPLATRYGRVGEIAVVDLDAALGRGSNAEVIGDLLGLAPCRVGGGLRDVACALAWLDRGAQKVVLGTAARPEVLKNLPRERVIAALDARHGEVVVEGWQKRTGHGVLERIAELRELAGGFLVTFVEREGRLQGTDLGFAKQIRAAAGGAAVTIAGGITTADEVAELDRLGCDAQVGMALYTDKLPLAEAFAAPLKSDRSDGLWPTVVVDERGIALGLCYSNLDSLRAALERGQGVYHSRTRGLWVKGATSGAVQELLRVDADCDRDCLRFTVRQQPPGFCHLATRTCWGADRGLGALARLLAERKIAAPAGSYTAKLLAEPDLLGAKLREEANELAEARTRAEVIHEAADVLYFTLTTLARHGVDLAEVEAALDRRALKVTRRD
ncbi:MAG TPA: phosphoribosyl-ATP diphosphatase [Geminicoccaceae bacterium]|nr:phosphoribosyl-ATP diphosphatase [Geminicoccaceae bacterium]